MGRLIVERFPQQGKQVESRTVFDKERITLGRSYLNDIIVDDPFVSPQHLIVARKDGKLWLRDLATDNGTQIRGNKSIRDKTVQLQSGDEVCIGRTRFRLLLPEHPVEPARPMDWVMAVRDFIDRPWVPLLTSILVLVLAIGTEYLEKPSEQFWTQEFYALLIGSVAGILSYPGLLSLYTFFRYKRSYFVRNLVVSNLGILLYILYEEFDPFLYFWILDPGLVMLLDHVFNFVLMTAVFWACVRLAKYSLSLKESLRLASIPLVLVLLSYAGTGELMRGFKNDPEFHTRLAPGLLPLTEPKTLDAFLEEGGREFTKLED